MIANHSGVAERMIDYIKIRRVIERRDLVEQLGIKPATIDVELSPHLASGLITEHHLQLDERFGQRTTYYRWGSRRLGLNEKRLCLGGCGEEFVRESSMQFMCPRCRARAADVSPYAP